MRSQQIEDLCAAKLVVATSGGCWRRFNAGGERERYERETTREERRIQVGSFSLKLPHWLLKIKKK
jgi:hypothetical protein